MVTKIDGTFVAVNGIFSEALSMHISRMHRIGAIKRLKMIRQVLEDVGRESTQVISTGVTPVMGDRAQPSQRQEKKRKW